MFCAVCQSIDFASLYGRKRLDDATRTSHGRLLGTRDEIALRAFSCTFCEWIARNLDFHFSGPAAVLSRPIRLCVEGSTVYDGRTVRGMTGFLFPIVRLRVEPFGEDDGIAELRLVSDETQAEQADQVIVNRKATTIAQCTSWLNTCRRAQHTGKSQERCNQLQTATLSSDEGVPGFRLIDTVNRRVVPATADEEYLALSYVWGSQCPTWNLVDDSLPETLPQTIQDAIELTLGVGVKYLWVDAICIPQHDLMVRQQQIQQMDVIYHQALGAIIAVGSNSDCGLAGISANPNPQRGLLIGARLLEWKPKPWDPLMAQHGGVDALFTPWSTRGWTMQEALMSRRRLIFGAQHLLLECPSATRQTTATDYIEQIDASFFNTLDQVGNNESMRKWNMHFYQQLLATQYLKRQLTHENDIINAFSGLASYLARAAGTSCCWAIPRHEFLAALMWAPVPGTKDCSPRAITFDGRGSPPSWHWSSLRLKSLGFVAGSQPAQIYNNAANDFTAKFNDRDWQELEQTGVLQFEGYKVDFSSDAFSSPSASDAEPSPNSTPTSPSVDERQSAKAAWDDRRGCFITCRSWAFASTTPAAEINEPNPLYPFARRLGGAAEEPLLPPNYQFVLLVQWQQQQQQRDDEGNATRIGWHVVPKAEWDAENPEVTQCKLR